VNSVKLNFFSNLAGSSIIALILLVVTPIYLRYLGADSFGLIGVFITLSGVAALLDAGITPALTRELAKQSSTVEGSCEIRTVVRTLELVYCLITVAVFAVVFSSTSFLTDHWLKPSSLDKGVVKTCLQLMAVQLAFQLPLSFYTGGFIGMQKQGLMNLLNIAMAATKAIGAIAVLVIFQGDVVDFFIWQTVATALHLVIMYLSLWSVLPPGITCFKVGTLAGIWRYAAGMFGITAVSILLTQLDKIILSRTLSLEHFGYYMLAWYIASILLRPVGPVFNAWLPRLTQFAMVDNKIELLTLYRKGAQLVNLLVIPAAIILATNSHLVLALYTGNQELANIAALPLTLLAIGSAFNGLMHMPYALTLAYGWTSFTIYQNTIAALIIVPLTYWLSVNYGITGGAVGWLAVNLGYVCISSLLIHRTYLRTEVKKWYLDNITLYAMTYFDMIKLAIAKK
jgi:O-antigen/teichoic acid export membrane protein